MTRDEHLAWCKERAHKYLDMGEIANAIASMISDMGKHPECKVNSGLAMLGMLHASQQDSEGARRFIDGFR